MHPNDAVGLASELIADGIHKLDPAFKPAAGLQVPWGNEPDGKLIQ